MTDRAPPGHPSRRAFLRDSARGAMVPALLGTLGGLGAVEPPPKSRPKVAAITTVFHYRSHAHVILENFLEPYLFNGRKVVPDVEVAGLYVDQFPANDMARAVAKQYGIPIFPTIAEALTLGGSTLAVDGVLSIAEQGDYPVNAKGQREYPRKRFFDAIVEVFERSGRVSPLFNDKHLSYRWDWARAMYDTARRLKVPLMAGSSVPLAQRRPAMELPEGATIEEAVSIHGGPLESYDFHGLEVLQSLVEARRGGEPGVASVQFLEGEALWRAAAEGLWSPELADRALAAELGPGQPSVRELVQTPKFRVAPPHGILLRYRDGLRAIVLRLGGGGIRWDFACRVAGEDAPRATSFYVGPWENRNLFKALSHAIQAFLRDRRPPYPVERTLLTTGALDAAMESRLRGGQRVETPHLAIAYQPADFRAFREMGATWKIVTEGTPQPPGIDPTGRNFDR